MSDFDKHVVAFFPTHIRFGFRPIQRLRSIRKVINLWHTFGWKWYVISFLDYLGLWNACSYDVDDVIGRADRFGFQNFCSPASDSALKAQWVANQHCMISVSCFTIHFKIICNYNIYIAFLCPRGPRPARGIKWSGCGYVLTSNFLLCPLRFLTKVESQVLLMVASYILYEDGSLWDCRNIQESWHHDIYFWVHRLRTLDRISRLRFLSKESQVLIMVASWYFIWVPLWDQYMNTGIYKSHYIMTYISRSADFELWPNYQG